MTLLGLVSFALIAAQAQTAPKTKAAQPVQHCSTMEAMTKLIQRDPSLPEKWRQEGERRYQAYLQSHTLGARGTNTTDNEIVIPIVFHLVDAASRLNGITDRDIYEQVEILNRDFQGKKIEQYKSVIPQEIYNRIGKIPVRFVLARRDPNGQLTSGIERRVNSAPLSHVAIKSAATGGLDVWDINKYMNVWVGTFSGADDGLLGISTFPFMGNSDGPQGVVIGITTLPYTSPTARNYDPLYADGATLSHEIGHYFYLFHTFGDMSVCNNQDFQLQSGWPLPSGAGPEGDDTPSEKAFGNIYFGNPSMDYGDGCSSESFGMMYGSFMNYFSDRALFMFSDGMRKRVMGTIDLYRPGLKTSDGATPPSAITDAYLVNVTSRGYLEQRAFVVNNTPYSAIVRNGGTTMLTGVTLNVSMDGGAATSTYFPLSLAAGRDTTLSLGNLSGAAGGHSLQIYTSSPNSGADNFTNNDTLYSFIGIITTAPVAAPLTQDFSGTFPPANWQVWNPHGDTTWRKSPTAGATAAGAAMVNNYDYPCTGCLDELVSPPVQMVTGADSALLTFKVANAVYDNVDVSTWDGLEVFVSGDGGQTYKLAYKKTGNQLKTIAAAQGVPFTATPAQSDRWRQEKVNLSPYIVAGKPMIVKFRNVTSYGNNTYIDDINLTSAVKPQVDLAAAALVNVPNFTCTNTVTPSVTVTNTGHDAINTYTITYTIDNGTPIVANQTTALPTSSSATISLGNVTGLSTGNHLLTVYTSSPNGVGDPNTSNDTLRKIFLIVPVVNAPLVESFEGATFPPNGWAINNPDNGLTWSKTKLAVKPVAASDSASAFVHNFVYNGLNRKDELYTPTVQYSNVDSVFLQFDLAAATYNYPGITAVPEDTLEVLITRDCGATFQSIYKKWGSQLQTLGDPNNGMSAEFTPGARALAWRRDSINLTAIAGGTSSFQVVFRNTHNSPGNNVYVDNINLFTRVLPETIKKQGYLILPTAFSNQFAVWHYEQPTTLRYINVFNSVGQLVWSKQYNGNAERYITINMWGKAPGVYMVRLGYSDSGRNVTQRVIKQ